MKRMYNIFIQCFGAFSVKPPCGLYLGIILIQPLSVEQVFVNFYSVPNVWAKYLCVDLYPL